MAVKIVNSKRVIGKLREARSRLKDPAPLMRDLSIKLHQNVIARFVLEKDPQEKPWKPSQRALRDGGQTLTDTGRLRGSIRFASDKNSAEVFTNSLVYAAPHNYGIGQVKRQFIGFGPQDEAVINQLANEYVSGPFR